MRLKAARIIASLILGVPMWGKDVPVCGQQNVVVNVRDRQANTVAGLQTASFRATVDGKTVKILSERAPTSLPRVVLLLDQSGSVNRSNHTLDTAVALANNFVKSNSSALQIALVLFSDHVIDTVNFGHSPNEVLQKLTNLPDGGGRTSLYDSLMHAAGLFDTPKYGDAVYAVTDGGDNHSKFRPRDVEREFVSKSIRIYSFVLSHQPPSSEEEEMGQSELAHWAEVTGGMVVSGDQSPGTKGSDAISNALRRAYDSMAHFYVLLLEVPPGDRPHSWKLEVVDNNGSKRKDVEISYPKRLIPCVIAPRRN